MYRFAFLIAFIMCLFADPRQPTAQEDVGVERDMRSLADMGVRREGGISVSPLGTAFDTVRRYWLDPKGANGFSTLLAASEPLGDWSRQLLMPAGRPRIYLSSKLDANASGLSAKLKEQILAFNGAYPAPERRASGVAAIIVHAVPHGDLSRSYFPYIDRKMITDCYLRTCVVLAIDLNSDETLPIASKQLAAVEKAIADRTWIDRGAFEQTKDGLAKAMATSSWAMDGVLLRLRALNRNSFGGLVLSASGTVASPTSLSWVISSEVTTKSRAE